MRPTQRTNTCQTRSVALASEPPYLSVIVIAFGNLKLVTRIRNRWKDCGFVNVIPALHSPNICLLCPCPFHNQQHHLVSSSLLSNYCPFYICLTTSICRHGSSNGMEGLLPDHGHRFCHCDSCRRCDIQQYHPSSLTCKDVGSLTQFKNETKSVKE